MATGRKSVLVRFRTADGKTGTLTDRCMTRTAAPRMIWRRARAAGIEIELGCYSFRATGITVYLQNGGPLEHAQQMAHMRVRERRSSTIGGMTRLHSTRLKSLCCRLQRNTATGYFAAVTICSTLTSRFITVRQPPPKVAAEFSRISEIFCSWWRYREWRNFPTKLGISAQILLVWFKIIRYTAKDFD